MVMRKLSSIKKTVAKNRASKVMPGMKAMKAMSASAGMAPSPSMNSTAGMQAPPSMGMRKGGSAKKGKMGIAIMIAVGKPKKGK